VKSRKAGHEGKGKKAEGRAIGERKGLPKAVGGARRAFKLFG
jgi:hypothetical protein